METIYSLILWDKLKHAPSECPIHKMSLKEIESEFKQYIDQVGHEQFKKDIRENSFLDIQLHDFYYDGQFYEFKDSHQKVNLQEDPKDPDRMIVTNIYHETMVESTILSLMMEHLGPESSKFLANVHKAWYEKQKNHQVSKE
jgi:hypothetical protein